MLHFLLLNAFAASPVHCSASFPEIKLDGAATLRGETGGLRTGAARRLPQLGQVWVWVWGEGAE